MKGNKTTKEYDRFENLRTIIDPDKGEINYSYDLYNRRVKAVGLLGDIWEYFYKPGFCCNEWSKIRLPPAMKYSKNLINIIILSHSQIQTGKKMEMIYDAHGNHIEAINTQGKRSWFKYDFAGNLIYMKDFEGETYHLY